MQAQRASQRSDTSAADDRASGQRKDGRAPRTHSPARLRPRARRGSARDRGRSEWSNPAAGGLRRLHAGRGRRGRDRAHGGRRPDWSSRDQKGRPSSIWLRPNSASWVGIWPRTVSANTLPQNTFATGPCQRRKKTRKIERLPRAAAFTGVSQEGQAEMIPQPSKGGIGSRLSSRALTSMTPSQASAAQSGSLTIGNQPSGANANTAAMAAAQTSVMNGPAAETMASHVRLRSAVRSTYTAPPGKPMPPMTRKTTGNTTLSSRCVYLSGFRDRYPALATDASPPR